MWPWVGTVGWKVYLLLGRSWKSRTQSSQQDARLLDMEAAVEL